MKFNFDQCSDPCYIGKYCSNLHCKNGGYIPFRTGIQRCVCGPNFHGDCCQQLNCGKLGVLNHDKTECVCAHERYYGDRCEKTRCANGGVDAGDGRCFCNFLPPYFQGEFCEQIICRNGGSPQIELLDSKCECSRMYKGPFCESIDYAVLSAIIVCCSVPIIVLISICIRWMNQNYQMSRFGSYQSLSPSSSESMSLPLYSYSKTSCDTTPTSAYTLHQWLFTKDSPESNENVKHGFPIDTIAFALPQFRKHKIWQLSNEYMPDKPCHTL